MVAYAPASSRPSKVAPRRHWTTMQCLVMHSRQLHQVLKAVEREEVRQVRLQSPRATVVNVAPAVAPPAKPLVFRKTKREIQRERELAERQNKTQETTRPVCHASTGTSIMRQLDTLRSTLLASCKRLTHAPTSQRRLSCRTQYLRRASGTIVGLQRQRCPPRRRLLF